MTISEYEKLEKKGLIEAFGLKENEVYEARYNLLGFFSVLQKIDQRLKREKIKKRKKANRSDTTTLLPN